MRSSIRLVLAAVVCLLLGSVTAPISLDAQDVERLGAEYGVRPPPGYYDELARNPQAFQFRNAWFRRSRAIFAERERLRRAGDVNRLNAAFPGGVASRAAGQAAAVAVTGTFEVPVLLGGFLNNPATAFDSAAYQAKLFSAAAAPPYSATTYYDEISRSLITLTGDVVGWFAADSNDTYYEGTSNCLNTGTSKCGEFLTELFVHFDSIVDFGVYDNDGPDGMPNSGDDDGTVDFVAIIHPETGGECGGTNIWSHRFVYRFWPAAGGSPYTTGDARSGGGQIMIDDYLIQGGLGGPSSCSPASIMSIGTFSHETGHAFGLPDLYDTTPGVQTFGAGHWELMASGGTDNDSPSHMSSWTLQQLGWVNVDTILGTSGFRSFDISPVQSSDTVFALCTSADPAMCFAEEHFMLENRQLIGADATSIPGAGLLIWHVDPPLIAATAPFNSVNREPDPGYDLEEADGARHLNLYVNLGDAGDPFPGTSGNTTFGSTTNPQSVFNDSTATNILVDSIAQNPDMSVHVALNFNTVIETIQTNVAGTNVIVDAATFPSPHSPVWTVSEMHTIGVDSIQNTAPGTRHLFQSWSDAGARSHMVTATAVPNIFTATLNTEHQLSATIGGTGTGTITSSTPLDGAGLAWFVENDVDSLIASADLGSTFLGWDGDTTSASDSLILTMDMPYTVQAIMGLPVAVVTDSALAAGVMGAAYNQTLVASGGSGSYVWSVIGGALPAGVTLDTLTGALTGVPAEDGDFSFTARATSVILTAEKSFGFSVSKPTLTLTNVLDELLTSATPLTADERRFLDLLGNANGKFDVGDLRAWLIDTGQLSGSVAASRAPGSDEEESEKDDSKKDDSKAEGDKS